MGETRGMDLDTLLAKLTELRDLHGNLPVVGLEARQDKYLGIDAVWAEDGTFDPDRAADRPVAVLLDLEEGSRPQATWSWS